MKMVKKGGGEEVRAGPNKLDKQEGEKTKAM